MEMSYENNALLWSQWMNSRLHLQIVKRTMLSVFKCRGSNSVSLGFDDWDFTLLAIELFGGETPSLEACLVSSLAMQCPFKVVVGFIKSSNPC